MTFPFEKLRATEGTLSGHLFENAYTGVARDLFWDLSVFFEPIELDDEEWEPSLACEWLTLPVRRWTELDGASLDTVRQRDRVETTFYVFEHAPCALRALSVVRRKGATFDVSILADLRFADETSTKPVQISCPLRFEGIFVRPDSLFPKPNTPALASEALGAFIDLTDLEAPTFERSIYTFAPRV